MMTPDPAAIQNNVAALAAEFDHVARTSGPDAAILEAAGMMQAGYRMLSTLLDPTRLACDLLRLANAAEPPPFTDWTVVTYVSPPAEMIDEAAHTFARVLRSIRNDQGPQVAIERAIAAVLASSRVIGTLLNGQTAAAVLRGYADLAAAAAMEPAETETPARRLH